MQQRLLIRDIVSIEKVKREVTSEWLSWNDPNHLRLYRIKRIGRPPHFHISKPTYPPFMTTTYYATITSLWYMHSFFLPCIQFSMFHVCMSSFLFLSLHGSPIQPSWLWSILIGRSTRLVFSKKRPYWMVLMPVYVETAEGLVKPLVILPAAVMPLSSFIPIFSRRHRPLCSCWFTPFSQPTTPPPHLTNHSHNPYPLCSHHYTINRNTF